MSSAFSPTSFDKRCEILGDLWINYRDLDQFKDFVEYNDLGLPLAYAIDAGIVDGNSTAESFINETFNLLLQGLGLEDNNYSNIDDILYEAEDKGE